MDMAIRVQNLDESVYISRSANTIKKVMNPTIFPLAMGK